MAITQDQLDILLRDTQQQPEPESQRLRSVAQGLTFGFADEIEAYIRSLGGDGPQYEAIRDDIRRRLSAYQEANPAASIGYETIGAIAPTALSLLTGVGAGAGAANVGRIATLGGRLPRFAQGAATGAAYGGLYGAGTAEGDIESRIEQARESAATGALFGAGGQAILGTIAGTTKPFVNLFKSFKKTDDVSNIGNQITRMSKNAYKSLDNAGVKISSQELDDAFNVAFNQIKQEYNIIPSVGKASSKLQDLTMEGVKDFRNIINRAYQSADNGVTLTDLQGLQRRLRRLYNTSKRGEGVEQPALLDLSKSIDRLVVNHSDSSALWQNAKNLWRTSSNFQRIDDAFDKASRRVEAGVNVDAASVYKRMANTLLDNKNASYFSNAEKDILRQFVSGNFVDNLLQAIGTYAPSSGNFMRLLAVGGAIGTGGATIPFTMLSQMAKSSSNSRIKQRSKELLIELAKGDETVLNELGDLFNSIQTSRVGLTGPSQLAGRGLSPVASNSESMQISDMQQERPRASISPEALSILRGQ
jgi:hypothetical protein